MKKYLFISFLTFLSLLPILYGDGIYRRDDILRSSVIYRDHTPKTFTGNANRVPWFTVTIPAWQLDSNAIMVWYVMSTSVNTTNSRDYYVTLNGSTIFSSRLSAGSPFNHTWQFIHFANSSNLQGNTFAHSYSFGNQTNADPTYYTTWDISQNMNFVFEVDLTSASDDITINSIDVWL